MAEIVQSGKGKKRTGVRLDMTPMVDVAFLLLTFFMLSTTLTTPQVMEISLPPDSKANIEIAEQNVLTLRLKDDFVFWNIGNQPPAKVPATDVGKILVTNLRANPKIATLIKIDRQAPYQKLVSVIDELNLAQISLAQTEKRFSILPMDDKDQATIANL